MVTGVLFQLFPSCLCRSVLLELFVLSVTGVFQFVVPFDYNRMLVFSLGTLYVFLVSSASGERNNSDDITIRERVLFPNIN